MALTFLLTRESIFIQQENASPLWSPLLVKVLEIFDAHKIRDADIDQEDDMPDDITLGEGTQLDEHEKLTLTKSYQAAFTALNFAGKPSFDPLPKNGENGVTNSNYQKVLFAGLKNMESSHMNLLTSKLDNSGRDSLTKFFDSVC